MIKPIHILVDAGQSALIAYSLIRIPVNVSMQQPVPSASTQTQQKENV